MKPIILNQFIILIPVFLLSAGCKKDEIGEQSTNPETENVQQHAEQDLEAEDRDPDTVLKTTPHEPSSSKIPKGKIGLKVLENGEDNAPGLVRFKLQAGQRPDRIH